MRALVFALVACFVAAVEVRGRALAAPPSLEAFAGALGGLPTGHDVPGMCSTYGPPEPESSFFPSSVTIVVPQGGIAGRGYSRDAGSLVSAAGPATASQAVGPVLLGNPGFAGTYTASAEAIADFKTLKAAFEGSLSAPGAVMSGLQGIAGAAVQLLLPFLLPLIFMTSRPAGAARRRMKV